MAIDVETEKVTDRLERVFVSDSEQPGKRHLAFEIDKDKQQVVFFPEDDFVVSKVLFDGFKQIPEEVNEKGYFKSGLGYYLDKKLREQKANAFIVSYDKSSSIRKSGTNHKVTINYDSFKKLRKNISALINENKVEKSQFVDDFFATEFPKKYESGGLSASHRAKKAINNLDEHIIDSLSPEDISRVLGFVEHLLKLKYKSVSQRYKLFKAAKIKVDDIAISSVLKDFDDLIAKDPHETKWGEFLKKNLYLLDSKYVSVIPQLNVVLSTERRVDFGLVDSNGFLDIFEIKKPTTSLLAANPDRGNYYWSTEAIKAIVQAEKYLYNAESKKDALANGIKRENKVHVTVIRPRVFLLMGMTNQLDSDNKKEDFRVLRMSLKNVEVILYDELLQRLKNQQNKIYIE